MIDRKRTDRKHLEDLKGFTAYNSVRDTDFLVKLVETRILPPYISYGLFADNHASFLLHAVSQETRKWLYFLIDDATGFEQQPPNGGT